MSPWEPILNHSLYYHCIQSMAESFKFPSPKFCVSHDTLLQLSYIMYCKVP
ncbi:hypothetical protein I79_026046 [Cricetulus griseus]|uniref:Uncharacterized protein n=1 Tax=Cricetulus griseus TaxID=10029 RepID=G3IPW3_CRIGR|nr:hypothetical protein I79_026046 [Cricetulus griseus]